MKSGCMKKTAAKSPAKKGRPGRRLSRPGKQRQ